MPIPALPSQSSMSLSGLQGNYIVGKRKMLFLRRVISQTIQTARWVLYPLLAVAPLYVQPSHFIRRHNRPMYARSRWLWTSPCIGAGLVASGMQKLTGQLLFQKMAQSGVLSHLGYSRFESLMTYSGWASFGFVVVMLYGVAALRWTYHRCATAVCRGCGLLVTGVPLLYFVFTTAVFGLWLGIATWVMARVTTTPEQAHYLEWLATAINAHPYLTVCIMLALTGAHLVSLQTRRQGMKEVYGNSGLALFGVDIISFALLLLALEVLRHTLPGR